MLLSPKLLHHADRIPHANQYLLRLRRFIRVVSRFEIMVVSRAGVIHIIVQMYDVVAEQIFTFLSLSIAQKYQNFCVVYVYKNDFCSIPYHITCVVSTDGSLSILNLKLSFCLDI